MLTYFGNMLFNEFEQFGEGLSLNISKVFSVQACPSISSDKAAVVVLF